MTTITQIRLTNVSSRERAAKLVEAIEGKTYMNFHVALCPVGGSLDVLVESEYDAERSEIEGMLMDLMASALMK